MDASPPPSAATVQPAGLVQQMHALADRLLDDNDAEQDAAASLIEAVVRRSVSLNRVLHETEPRRRASVAAEPQFARALPLSDLLEAVAAREQTCVQPTVDERNEHRAGEHEHAHHSEPAFYSQHQYQPEATLFIGERMMSLATEPVGANVERRVYPMSGYDVAMVLGERFGGLTCCTSARCEGVALGGWPLMAYLSPDELRQYFMSGELPPADQRHTLCYLCLLKLLNATVSMLAAAAEQTVGDRRLRLPFYHVQNVPGGYVAEAMNDATQCMPAGGLTLPLRRYCRTDYVLTERQVRVPTLFDEQRRRATQWTTQTIRCYAERAQLFYATPDSTRPACAQLPYDTITAPAIVACEDLLARRFLPSSVAAAAMQECALDELEQMSRALGCGALPVQLTLGGQLAPSCVAVLRSDTALQELAAPQQTRLLALICCDLAVARARVLHAVAASLNDWTQAFQRCGLLPPLASRSAENNSKENKQNDDAALLSGLPYSSHVLCYLLEARWRELGRWLAEPDARSLDVLPLTAAADPLASALAAPGVRDQVREYRRSLMPLRQWMRQRREQDLPLNDTEWFACDRQNPVCVYLRLRPAPPPVYFTPSDVAAAAADIRLQAVAGAGPARLLGSAAAVNGLPANVVGDAMPQDYSLAFGEFAQCVAELQVERAARVRAYSAYWQPTRHARSAQIAEERWVWRLEADNDDDNSSKDRDDAACAAYTARLRAAMADEPLRCRVWHALSWRVNAAYAMLHWICGELAQCDQVLTLRSGEVCAWLPDEWDAEYARRVRDVLTRHANDLDVVRDLVPAVASMPALDAHAAEAQLQRYALVRLAQCTKRHLAAHVPLINALLDADAVYDHEDATQQCVRQMAPVRGWTPGVLCAETLLDTAPHIERVEFVATHLESSLFSWMMSAVAPTSAHVADFVGRHRQCVRESDECALWTCELLYAHLCGLYPHARNVAPYDVWLRAYRVFGRGRPTAERRRTLERVLSQQADADERLCFLAARERFVADVDTAAAFELHVRAAYGDWRAFCTNVLAQCDNIRADVDGCRLHVCNRLAASAVARVGQPHWGVFHSPPPSFPAFVAACVHEVDVRHDQQRCVQARRPLTADELCPPAELLLRVGHYVETRTGRDSTVFSRRWLLDLGVAESSVDAVERLYVEYTAGALNDAGGEAALQRLNACAREDYLVVAVFYTLLRAHTRRSLVQLDEWTTARQYEALVRLRGAEQDLVNASQALASSVQCCNTLRTHTVENAQSPVGFLKMRLLFTSDTLMCHSKLSKQSAAAQKSVSPAAAAAKAAAAAASSSSSSSSSASAASNGRSRTTETRCAEAREQLQQAEQRLAESAADEQSAERQLLRKQIERAQATFALSMRAHVQSVCRQRYRLPCKLMPMTRWPAAGYVFEQRDAAGRGTSCTVCPSCGLMTAFSPGMWSANGFQCVLCDEAFREQLQRHSPPRCAVCDCAMRVDGGAVQRHALDSEASTAVWLVDDVTHPVVHTTARCSVCQSCSRRWLATAARAFPLSELRYVVANRDCFDQQLVELLDPPRVDALRTQIAAARRDPSMPVPRVATVTDLPQHRRRAGRFRTQPDASHPPTTSARHKRTAAQLLEQ